MKTRKASVSLALRLWLLASVFVVPFLDTLEIALWCLPGIGLALWWRALPEDSPEPPPRLPYQHLYERPRDPE
jgi:hypothetical protein